LAGKKRTASEMTKPSSEATPVSTKSAHKEGVKTRKLSDFFAKKVNK